MNWGECSTWQNVIDHILRRQYGAESMRQAHTYTRIWMHLTQLAQWNVKQYTIVAIPFILIGLFSLWKKHVLLLFTLAFFIMHSIVFSEILNFSSERQELFCVRVFMLPCYIITALWFALGCQWVSQKLLPAKAAILETLGVVILFTIVLTCNYKENDMHRYFYARDHADNILKSLEQNAIIFPSGDHNTFPLIYLHYVENVRPDIVIADKYGYIEYDLYKDIPDASQKIKTLSQREEIEAHIISNSSRPVYFTIKPRLHLLPEYTAMSHGMLFRICKKEGPSPNLDLPQYHYKNIEQDASVIDHAATVILSDYYFYLASNALRQNQVECAMVNIKKAATLSEGLKEEMNNLATLLAEYGQDDQAITYFEEAAKLDKNYVIPRWNLAYLFKAKGDVLHAIQVFNDLARLDPEDYRIFGELGFLLYKYGHTELAIKNWGKSLSLNPEQPQMLKAMAEIKTTSQ